MGVRESLLRAVCENPDDDLPRLVFADWLEEHGEPDRAEHIRMQVRLTQLFRDAAPGTREVREKERNLWTRFARTWRAELPRLRWVDWFPEFNRGFVERADVSTDKILVRHADEVFNRVPVQHLMIRRFAGVEGFANLPYLGRLKTLALSNPRANEAVVRQLLRCDLFRPSLLLHVNFEPRGTELYPRLREKFGDRVFWPPAPPDGPDPGPT